MARSLRSDHDDVDEFRRFDAAEVDVEAVRESKDVALFQVRLDGFFIELGLFLIVDEDHDDVGLLGSFGSRVDFHALLFGFLPASGTFIETDDDVDAGLFQVQRMSVALRTVTDDGNGLAVEFGDVTICLIENTISHS